MKFRNLCRFHILFFLHGFYALRPHVISVITVWTDPMHESLVLIVYALKPHMNAHSNSARLDDLFMVYFYTLFLREVKALVRLRICTKSSFKCLFKSSGG